MKIENFNDVDMALKRLCEVEVSKSKLEGEVTLKCNDIKEAYKPRVEALSNEANFIRQEIENYCEANKGEFAEKRSKEMAFGVIGYRVSKSISLPRVKAKIEGLLQNLKSFGLRDCIIYEEKPNKEALVELDDASLVKLGLKRVVRDNFRVEPKLEALESK